MHAAQGYSSGHFPLKQAFCSNEGIFDQRERDLLPAKFVSILR